MSDFETIDIIGNVKSNIQGNDGMLEDIPKIVLDEVEEEAETLPAVLRLRGGGKKRKKKHYTTPRKIKHKKKKQKLAYLKYYKVDVNGKVKRLRKECPLCGPGIFMADMEDRHYCGRCCFTIYKDDVETKPTADNDDPSQGPSCSSA